MVTYDDTRRDERLSLLASSGQNGRREIKGVLKIFPDVENELLGDFLFFGVSMNFLRR